MVVLWFFFLISVNSGHPHVLLQERIYVRPTSMLVFDESLLALIVFRRGGINIHNSQRSTLSQFESQKRARHLTAPTRTVLLQTHGRIEPWIRTQNSSENAGQGIEWSHPTILRVKNSVPQWGSQEIAGQRSQREMICCCQSSRVQLPKLIQIKLEFCIVPVLAQTMQSRVTSRVNPTRKLWP